MKTTVAVALALILGGTVAGADDALAALQADLDLSEIVQDADKTLLREALLLLGRGEMGQTAGRPTTVEAEKRAQAERVALRDFVDAKTAVIVKRAAELRRKAAELSAMEKSAAPKAVFRPSPVPAAINPRDDPDKQKLVEKLEEAQIEVQVLSAQTQMYQQPLNAAVNALASAEIAAGDDETQRDKAVAARKALDRVKTRYVELMKKLRLEQTKLTDLQRQVGGSGFQ